MKVLLLALSILGVAPSPALIPISGTVVPGEPTLTDCTRTCEVETGFGTTVHIISSEPVFVWVTHK